MWITLSPIERISGTWRIRHVIIIIIKGIYIAQVRKGHKCADNTVSCAIFETGLSDF